MGSEKFYPEERPVHDVTVDGFWMDRCVCGRGCPAWLAPSARSGQLARRKAGASRRQLFPRPARVKDLRICSETLKQILEINPQIPKSSNPQILKSSHPQIRRCSSP